MVERLGEGTGAERRRGVSSAPTEIEEPLPLPVVPDWDEQVKKATELTRLIDRHLNYEEKLRRMLPDERLTPVGLCPEQRVSMLTDLWAMTHSQG